MKELTELVIIIDRSGSMHGLEKDVVGGFNSLIEEQKKEGDTLVTTVFFNHKVSFIHEGVDINLIQKLKNEDYQTSGCTALYDAIGDAICYIKSKHAKLSEDELPKNTIISIMTDGYENASKEFSRLKIKEMIELQKKCGWTFIFQGASLDIQEEGIFIGVDPSMTSCFTPDEAGVRHTMKHCSAMISKIRRKKTKK